MFVFFFKQKTAYEMRISDWSSDVCSSDLIAVLWCNGEIGPIPEVLRATAAEIDDHRVGILVGRDVHTRLALAVHPRNRQPVSHDAGVLDDIGVATKVLRDQAPRTPHRNRVPITILDTKSFV